MIDFSDVRYSGEVRGSTLTDLVARADARCRELFGENHYTLESLDVGEIRDVSGKSVAYRGDFHARPLHAVQQTTG